jgi:FkbM family methyltransferase
LKKFIKKLLARLSIKISRVNELHDFGLYKSKFKRSKDSKTLYLKDFDLVIDPVKHYYILQGLRIMTAFKTGFGASFAFREKDVLIATINEINYNIQTFEELYILNEIITNGIYNFITSKAFAVIDIGLNVGFTSLYMAGNPRCKTTYSFEPFKATFNQALFNISLNHLLMDKITLFNYGLGNEARKMEINYDANMKGNMGINGIPAYILDQNPKIVKDEIEIKNAAAVLTPILSSIKDQKLNAVLKIDCEGAEYEIFDSLVQAQLLGQFNTIIIEWHAKGPGQLAMCLKEAGYALFSFNPVDIVAGMIYAFKD